MSLGVWIKAEKRSNGGAHPRSRNTCMKRRRGERLSGVWHGPPETHGQFRNKKFDSEKEIFKTITERSRERSVGGVIRTAT